MGRIVLAGAVLGALACTSVRMVQRDGCWMKKTESTFGGSSEELGFCSRAQPQWAEDRLARLVQECMAQADYRWENRAIAAWTRNQPIPPQEADAEITRACMAEATQALGIEAQNQQLRDRVAELAKDRESLRSVTDEDREFLQQNSDKMVTALGEAAKKPPPNATATATVKSESEQRSSAQPPVAPSVTVVGVPAVQAPAVQAPAAAPAPACAAGAAKLARRKGVADKPQCEKPAAPAAAEPPETAALRPKAG